MEAVNSREQELKEITRQLLSTGLDSVSAEAGRIRHFVAGELGNVLRLLGDEIYVVSLFRMCSA